ncbi:MAG: TlpA family protein disulfide reductase [Gammaproteobacteria bacterium]|nr:TlpA family protein disulfide reductase [Gammaproteobacteria bacterium]MCP5299931.1 TlpA family protein disulfide reductase [Chromatiaceae bacterium]
MSDARRTSSRIPASWILALALAMSMPFASALAAGQLQALPPGLRAEIDLPDLDGRTRTLGEFHGQTILVNFWASWCTPCIREMPDLVRLQQTLQDESFLVLGINVGEADRRVQTIAHQLHMDFPVLLDRDSREFERWGVQVLPTSYLVDPEGNVRFAVIGTVDWNDADVIEAIRSLSRGAVGPQQASGK